MILYSLCVCTVQSAKTVSYVKVCMCCIKRSYFMNLELFPVITQTRNVIFEVKGMLPWSYF